MYKFILLLFLFSCAQQQVNQRKAEMEATLGPLLGSSEETIIMQLGTPGDIQEMSGIKVYRYRRSYGARTMASGNAYANPYGANAYGVGKSWESYDEYNIYFKDGVMVKWDGYVQR